MLFNAVKELIMDNHLLDKYLSPAFRHTMEINYYEKINALAKIEEALKAPIFLTHPLKHLSFSNDHGVIHVRDIALRMLVLLEQLNGVHFSKRANSQLEFMKGYGAMLAYVHDIGIANETYEQEYLHGPAAAQSIFQEHFDQLLSLLWEENSGNVVWRLTKLTFKKALPQHSKNILREILALCGLHAKENCSVELLNQPAELRQVLQKMIAWPLRYQVLQHDFLQLEKQCHTAQLSGAAQKSLLDEQKQTAEKLLNDYGQPGVNNFLQLYYQDFWQNSFQWLISENPEVISLTQDLLDTVRVFRAANASRQRGTKLRATGDHQIFLDHHSASAIFAVQAEQKLFLLESKNTLLAGEVNLSSTEFTQAGDLRISFYRGQFSDEQATKQAVFNAAFAINEVQIDMIGSFVHAPGPDYLKQFDPAYILLENCDDNPDFSSQVQEQLILLNPTLKDIVRIVPSLQNSPEAERNRYLSAKELDWDLKTQNEILDKIADSGHKISNMKVQEAFNHVKCADISAGEVLMQAETYASFVYIPLSVGLMGYPLGGYAPFHVSAYIPLGNVGVIRGDIRNATIIAEEKLRVLMVPKEVYLAHWHNTYSEQEFIEGIKNIYNS